MVRVRVRVSDSHNFCNLFLVVSSIVLPPRTRCSKKVLVLLWERGISIFGIKTS